MRGACAASDVNSHLTRKCKLINLWNMYSLCRATFTFVKHGSASLYILVLFLSCQQRTIPNVFGNVSLYMSTDSLKEGVALCQPMILAIIFNVGRSALFLRIE